MVKNEKRIMIHRPVEEVFAFVGDLQNAPTWQPELLEVRRTTEGPLGIGTRYTSVRKFMGRQMEASSEFVAFESNRKVAFANASGPVPFETSYDFEPAAEGTQLTAMVELQPKGFLRLAEPLMARSLRREMETHFSGLKALLECQAASTS
jgi:uncharacterized membrane protein